MTFVVVLIILVCLLLCLGVPCGFALILPAMRRLRDSSARLQSNQDLKQCALAVHNYHDFARKLPNAFGPAPKPQGGPLFGIPDVDISMWTALMPFVEAEKPYREGKTDAVVKAFSS